MDLIQITGSKSLVRDMESGAILNTQTSTADTLKHLKEQKRNEKLQLEKNTNDINSIKSEVSEIKTMLKILIEGRNDGR